MALGVPTMYEIPRARKNPKFSSLTIPRSFTQTPWARPYLRSMAPTIVSIVVESAVLPENTS